MARPKVEQSDIDAACYIAHGDYSGIVISPTSIEECFYEIQKLSTWQKCINVQLFYA